MWINIAYTAANPGNHTKQNLSKIILSNQIYFKHGKLLRAVVRENQRFFLKFGKCDLTDFDETLHTQRTLRINNLPEILDFLVKWLPC